MKTQFKYVLFYAVAIAVSIASILAVLKVGATNSIASSVSTASWGELILAEVTRNITSPLASLVIQILVILVFSRFCSFVLKWFGQPQVIGEMIAGILLGKSFFAILWPVGFDLIFPESSMPQLFFLSQIGLIFFMFVIGLHLKVSELKDKGATALLVSHVSIVLPFFLGTLLALAIYKTHGPANYDFTSFALFMGIAMSITAFPVLARILQEKKMTHTSLGTMALTCAAIDDVTAWCVLAAVIGIVKAGSMITAIAVLTAAMIYVAVMFKAVRPLVAKVMRTNGDFTNGQLGFLFCILLGSALVAEIIGIHALFGAFLAGVIMPQNVSFRNGLMEKIEDLTSVVLLPIFFVYTGLRTQVGLLDSFSAWGLCAAIIFLAIFGKMVGSALAARWTGMPWRDSWALGALMNTRGLMELIVLNIGYDLGILKPDLFAMMILMAIVTTAMTTPLLTALRPSSGRT